MEFVPLVQGKRSPEASTAGPAEGQHVLQPATGRWQHEEMAAAAADESESADRLPLLVCDIDRPPTHQRIMPACKNFVHAVKITIWFSNSSFKPVFYVFPYK